MPATPAVPGLSERVTTVAGRPAAYAVGGTGPDVVFLHGWGLAHPAYRTALTRIVGLGMRVLAPSMPGFGGTAELPVAETSLRGYARWVAAFLAATGVSDPVTLVGHSFGGGVAIRTAHDHPDRVARLVVVNSVGGSAWTAGSGIVRRLRRRPPWDWGLHLPADLRPVRQVTRVLPVVVADGVPNFVRNPRAVLRAAQLAATADLVGELEELKRRRLPVVVLWGRDDTVLPDSGLDVIRDALGDPHVVTVRGGHSWLLADPDGFGEVITNVIGLTPDEPRQGFAP
jgi:pimeloyl-ACP methyl ester carboxylesterase